MSLFSSCGAKYKVTYDGDFKGGKSSYREGANVKVYFDVIATDTDYSFYVDGESVRTNYSEDKGYIIEFTMPAHDVVVSYSSKNSMIYIPPQTDGELVFDTFAGGGPQYSVEIEDESVVNCEIKSVFTDPNHGEIDGESYEIHIIFTGLKPGETSATVKERSPIGDNQDIYYDVVVDDELNVTLTESGGSVID